MRLREELDIVSGKQHLFLQVAGNQDGYHIGTGTTRLLALNSLRPDPDERLLLASVEEGKREATLWLNGLRQ